MYIKIKRLADSLEFWAVPAKSYGGFRNGVLILDGNEVRRLFDAEYIVVSRGESPQQLHFEFNFLKVK
jgi:hypothetical protein